MFWPASNMRSARDRSEWAYIIWYVPMLETYGWDDGSFLCYYGDGFDAEELGPCSARAGGSSHFAEHLYTIGPMSSFSRCINHWLVCSWICRTNTWQCIVVLCEFVVREFIDEAVRHNALRLGRSPLSNVLLQIRLRPRNKREIRTLRYKG